MSLGCQLGVSWVSDTCQPLLSVANRSRMDLGPPPGAGHPVRAVLGLPPVGVLCPPLERSRTLSTTEYRYAWPTREYPEKVMHPVHGRAEYFGLKVRTVHASEHLSHTQVWSERSARTQIGLRFNERDTLIARRMKPVRNPNLPVWRATSTGTATRI